MAKRSQSSKSSRRTVKKRKKRTGWSRLQTYLLGGTVSLLIVALLMGFAGWIGYEKGRKEATKICQARVAGYRNDLEKLRRKLKSRPIIRESKKESGAPKIAALEKIPKKKENLSEIKDYVTAGGRENGVAPVRKEVHLKKPKLAIVIDDVAYAYQIKAIRKLPWHITPSIFPPTATHPDTPKIAAKLDHFMIHLPMEAMRYNNPEEDTLTTESSEAEIDLRIRKLRHWFPGTHFINNHTGSKFTSDLGSMERFYPIARRYGFVFIDSRTTPKTVVPRVCREYHDPYVARDIFLDNKPDVGYIQNQLKKAVALARAHGYAIAIGHPHNSTLKALAGSKSILKGVDVVYIDELYGKIR